jgi:formyl-CoA transferase
MGRADLREDPRFATLKARVAHMDLVDEIVSGWTRDFAKEDLFQLLLERRIPSAPVRDLGEVMNDPHLHERGALKRVDHPALGEAVLPTGALRFGEATPPELVPSKELGADNEAVYCGWLGLSPGELGQLRAEGVV